VLVLVLVPVCGLVIATFRQGSAAIGQLSTDTPTLAEIVTAARRWVPFLDTIGTPEELRTLLENGIRSVSESASGAVLLQVRAIPAMLLQLGLVVLATYFALVDGHDLFTWIAGKLPLSGEIRDRLSASFHGATKAVVLASVAAAGTQALVIFVGFWALGVPAALLAAGTTFVLGWVPALSTAVWGAAAVYLYAGGSLTRALVMVAIGLGVGVVDNIVRAIVLRGQKAMHPLVSLLAVLGGIVFFGVPGVFIGPLVAFMAIAVLEIWPSVASYCGIAVSGSGDQVPDVPMLSPESEAIGAVPDATS
jgi:predicted PurR-regulated permease PerM